MNDFQQEEVFQAFIQENRQLWVKLAYRVLENHEEAEDLVQETLALLWKRRLLEVETRGPTRPGLFGSMPSSVEAEGVRAVIGRGGGTGGFGRKGTGKLGEVGPPSIGGSPSSFSETQRTVIRMKYYMGLSFREIGEALRISLNTAGSRCRYALEALREALRIGIPKDR